MNRFERVDTTANRIKQAMEGAGKRQTDIAKETGIDKGALSRYLKGTYEPKQDAIYKIAVALNVSEMWLWGYDCPKERTSEQKKNDALADIVAKMRKDEVFLVAVEKLYQLDEEKLKSISQMLDAFLK